MTIGNLPPSIGGNLLHAPTTSHVTRYIHYVQGEGGTFSASPTAGYEGDIVTLTNTPSAHYTFSGYDITGATLTGNKFEFGDTDVTVEAKFYPTVYTVTTQTDGHGKISASTTGGTYGTNVTLYNTAYDGYRLGSYSITGSTLTGDSFDIGGDTTARANFVSNTASGRLYSGNYLCNAIPQGHPGEETYSAYRDSRTFNIDKSLTGYNYITLWWPNTRMDPVGKGANEKTLSITWLGNNGNSWVMERGTGSNSVIYPAASQAPSGPICTGDFNRSRTASDWTGVYKHGTCWYARGVPFGRKLIYDPQNKRCSAYAVDNYPGNDRIMWYLGWKSIDLGTKITSAIAYAESGAASNYNTLIYAGIPVCINGFNRFSDARKCRPGKSDYSAFRWE